MIRNDVSITSFYLGIEPASIHAAGFDSLRRARCTSAQTNRETSMTGVQTISHHHEGADLQGQLATPAGPGPHPAVLVMHNALGLGHHMKDVARRLAEQGYIALASDMYGGGVVHKDSQGAGSSLVPIMQVPGLLRARIVAWFEHFKTLPGVDTARMGAIGYCFGGQCVLELARSGADAKAVVSYHGLLTTTQKAVPGQVKAYAAVYTGARDPYAPYDQVQGLREELIAGGAPWQITEFGEVYHAFTDPDAGTTPIPGLGYDPLADKVSWAGTLALLETLVKGT
jgi:dienelactone hydrolase